MQPDATPRPRPRPRRAPAAILAAAALLLPAPLAAQRAARTDAAVLQFEARADALVARWTSAQLGLGVNLPLGNYVRAGLTAAGGGTWVGPDAEPSGRLDAVARFLLDPYREHRWGPYAGGGMSALYDGRFDDWSGAIVAVLGVEGSARGPVRAALELGLGGGTRIGLVLRWGRRDRR